jgi:23S rRNA pseudouridine2604 synthase
MSAGLPVLGTKTKPCIVRQLGNRSFKITLTQGLNRQIRRMCEFLDYGVISLKRIRIMNIGLGNLAVGKWRNLSFAETEELNKMLSGSSKTEEASLKRKKR